MTQSSTDQATVVAAEGPADATMSIRESLSALVDGEASELEVHRLLKLSESEPDIRSRWRRYHLVRSVLKSELATTPSVDLSDRISAAIAQEASLDVPLQEGSLQASGRKQWRDSVGKVAIAASVAFAFVVGIQQFSPPGDQLPTQMAESSESAPKPVSLAGGVPSGFELPPFAARAVSTGPGLETEPAAPFAHYSSSNNAAANQAQLQHNQALQNYFNYLLLKHAEQASTNGSMGLLPYARVSRMEAAQE